MSRRFVAATERQMGAWLKRDLSALELAVIMIDGVHVEDHVLLIDEHPGAAGSLEEGLDETLTVKRFGLPQSLERTLSTTNAIENLMESFRRLSRNVHRWKNTKMIERWMVTAVIDAGTRFRKIRGYVGCITRGCRDRIFSFEKRE